MFTRVKLMNWKVILFYSQVHIWVIVNKNSLEFDQKSSQNIHCVLYIRHYSPSISRPSSGEISPYENNSPARSECTCPSIQSHENIPVCLDVLTRNITEKSQERNGGFISPWREITWLETHRTIYLGILYLLIRSLCREHLWYLYMIPNVHSSVVWCVVMYILKKKSIYIWIVIQSSSNSYFVLIVREYEVFI